MAEGIVTLKERRRRRMEKMERAVAAIDAVLTIYARQHGGRFIRFGSSAKARMRMHSDVDVIADFPDDEAGCAATYAELVCEAHGMPSDTRPIGYASARLLERALQEGVILS